VTVDEMIYALMELSTAGHGDCDVLVMEYAGGNDRPAYVTPKITDGGGAVMLEARYSNDHRWLEN
jgi:hypothetical protein